MQSEPTDSLERLTEELEATQASSARRAYLLSAVGHDLKNPLFGICLQAEVAEQSLTGGDVHRVREALRSIQECGAQATAMLDRYLELSRLSRLEDEPVSDEAFSVDAMIERIGPRVRHLTAEYRIRLDVRPSDGLTGRADTQRVEHILVWLLDVAIRRVPGGVVQVTAERGPDVIAIRIRATRESAGAVDVAAVSGHDDRRCLDEMGLILARRLADQIGGGIESESGPDSGCRISVMLPVVSEEQEVLRASRVTG